MSTHTASDLDCVAIVCDELLMLVAETADYQQDQSVVAALRETVGNLTRLRVRLLQCQKRYTVAIVGLTNVGKSTLLNALFGLEFAPRRNGPCTSAPIEFKYGSELNVAAYFTQSTERPLWRCGSIAEVHQTLAQLADERASRCGSPIDRVVVEAPIPLLHDGLIVVDTPGFGAGQASEQAGTHEQSVRRYLAGGISQVFWVVLADQGIGSREKQFHDQLFAQVCDDIVVTGSEDWEPADRDRFKERFGKLFGIRTPRFHFVSGLQGLTARRCQDAVQLEAAGIPLLEARIRELADPVNRLESMRERLLQIVDDVTYWLRHFRDSRGKPLENRWRPDSFARWQSLAPAALTSRLTAMLTRN